MNITDLSEAVSGPDPHHGDARKICNLPCAMITLTNAPTGRSHRLDRSCDTLVEYSR
jgi:streptogramin lyase